ncbi:MAG: DUF6191 domain-containing protein [Jatrophihabitans sp.]
MTQWGLDTLFNPAKRHMDEEKQRMQSTREEVGDNSGGKRIDLASGKVTIKRADETSEDDAAGSKPFPADGLKSVPESKSDESPGELGAKSAKEPSAAAIRAAKRRGREPR